MGVGGACKENENLSDDWVGQNKITKFTGAATTRVRRAIRLSSFLAMHSFPPEEDQCCRNVIL